RLHDGAGRERPPLHRHRRGRRDLHRGDGMSIPERADRVPLEHKATAPRAIGCFVPTISDSKTSETDTSGALIREHLVAAGHTVVGHAIVRDEPTQVTAVIRKGCADPAIEA